MCEMSNLAVGRGQMGSKLTGWDVADAKRAGVQRDQSDDRGDRESGKGKGGCDCEERHNAWSWARMIS